MIEAGEKLVQRSGQTGEVLTLRLRRERRGKDHENLGRNTVFCSERLLAFTQVVATVLQQLLFATGTPRPLVTTSPSSTSHGMPSLETLPLGNKMTVQERAAF